MGKQDRENDERSFGYLNEGIGYLAEKKLGRCNQAETPCLPLSQKKEMLSIYRLPHVGDP